MGVSFFGRALLPLGRSLALGKLIGSAFGGSLSRLGLILIYSSKLINGSRKWNPNALNKISSSIGSTIKFGSPRNGSTKFEILYLLTWFFSLTFVKPSGIG